MKSKLKRVTLILSAFFVLIGSLVSPISVKAEEINVTKSGTLENFIDNVPVEDLTTFIDVDKITSDNYTWESTIENVEMITFDGTQILAIKHPLGNGEEYTSSGSLLLTFEDAFINSDGSRSDLVLEISDIYVKQLVDNPDVYYYGIISGGKTLTTEAFSQDCKGFIWNAQEGDPLYIKANQRTNRSTNFKVYKKDGSNDKFVFGIKDLDVGDYTSSGSTGDYNGEYIESIEAINGYGNVYMPESNILKIENGKMSATATDDNTWNTGYISILSSNNQSKWRASGRNTATKLFETLPFHKVEDSVIGGGEIKYVKSDDEIDQGLIIAGGGDNVSIVTRPLEGHKIKKITVDGEDVTPEDKLLEYTYSFNDIHEDHEIIAEYEPFTYKINYDANGGEGDVPSQTFTFEDVEFMSSENIFTRKGFTFTGFKLEGRDELIETPEDFRAVLVALGDGAEITLVAQWIEKEETQTFLDYVQIEKYWDDDSDAKGFRPSSVQFIITDSEGNVYDGSDEQHTGLLTSENYYSDYEFIEFLEKDLEEKRSSMSEEEIAEAEEFIADAYRKAEEEKEQYGTNDMWIGGWFFRYEAKERRTYTIEEPDIEGYYLSHSEESSDPGAPTFTFVNTVSDSPTYFIDLITVMKFWDDNDNADNTRPDQLQLIIKDDQGNVYDGSDTSHIGLLTKDNLLNMEELFQEAQASYEAQKETMTEEERAEALASIENMKQEVQKMKDEFGSAEYWFGMWFINYEGTEGRTYTIEEPSIKGYKLIKSKSEGERGNQVFMLKNGIYNSKTYWVDESGKALHPSEDGTLDPKVFPNYKLVKTEVKDNGDTVHTYHHIQTSWVDEKDEKIVQSKPGEYPKETFPNYEFVKSETYPNGDVIHHYHKIVDLKFIVDGKTVKEDKIKRGADGVAPEVTPKNGYKFVGWDKEFKNIQVDTVVTAKLEPIKYPITYVLDGGKNDNANPSNYTIEDAVTLKNPVKLGAKFLGWKEGNAIAKGSTGAKTFTAQWEIVTAPVNTGYNPALIEFATIMAGSLGGLYLALKKKKKS